MTAVLDLGERLEQARKSKWRRQLVQRARKTRDEATVSKKRQIINEIAEEVAELEVRINELIKRRSTNPYDLSHLETSFYDAVGLHHSDLPNLDVFRRPSSDSRGKARKTRDEAPMSEKQRKLNEIAKEISKLETRINALLLKLRREDGLNDDTGYDQPNLDPVSQEELHTRRATDSRRNRQMGDGSELGKQIMAKYNPHYRNR